MRGERSKASVEGDEDSLGSGRKGDHQPIPPDVRVKLAPLWSLYTGGAWPLLPETNRVRNPDPLGLPAQQACPLSATPSPSGSLQ